MSRAFMRNSTFGTLAGLATTLGNFFSGLIVARVLGVEASGAVAFALWAALMTATVLGAGLPFTLSRYLPELTARGPAGAKDADGLIAFLRRPYLALTLAPTAALLAYAAWLWRSGIVRVDIAREPFSDPALVALVAIACAAQAFGEFARGMMRGLQRFDAIARITLLSTVLQVAVIGIGAAFCGVSGALFGYVIGGAVPAAFFFARRSAADTPPIDLRRRVARYAAFRWASEVANMFIWSRVEIFFLQVFWGGEAVGLFAIGLTLANLAIQGPLMLTWGLLPHFSQQFGRNALDDMRAGFATATRLLAFLVFPACIGLAAIMPEFLPALYGEAFAGAVPSSTILVASAGLAATTTVGSSLVSAMERSDVDFAIGLVGAALSVLGGLVLVRAFGLMGAASSRALTQIVVVALLSHYVLVRRGFPISVRALALLAMSASACALAARIVLIAIPGVKGLAPAILVAAIVYVAAVRVTGALPRRDIEKLRAATRHLPGSFADVADRCLLMIASR